MYIHKKWFIQNALSKYKLHVIETFFENVNIKNVSYNESQQEVNENVYWLKST